MLKLILGLKGSGKTKTLIEMVNDASHASNGSVVCVEFASVGKKKFLNPEAFYGGYLSLERLIRYELF